MLDHQAGTEDGREDLGHRVHPLEALGVSEFGIGRGVGALALVEPIERGAEKVFDDGGAGLVDRHHQRVDLVEIEDPARFDQIGHHLGPSVEVRQPVEGTDTGVDHVEGLTAERRDGVVDVGLDPIHLEAGPPAEHRCRLDRTRREVESGASSTESGPTDRVGTQVALQVQEPCAVDRADLARLPRSQVVTTGDEAGEIVERRIDVSVRHLVPEPTIDVEPLRFGVGEIAHARRIRRCARGGGRRPRDARVRSSREPRR